MITLEQLKKIARGKINEANAKSVLDALNKYGVKFGLDQPHRIVQFLAQVMHESGEFRYDKEIASGAAYEGRKNLGNTQPGDGVKFRGRTAMQITGRANVTEFRDWCRKYVAKDAPDFVKSPELLNTDPWEGLGPLWYWDTRKLNKYADQGDVENITKKINGGLNGYADRLELLSRASLVLLGHAANGMIAFQKTKSLIADGSFGPKTRAALHADLVRLTAGAMAKKEVTIAPVVEETKVAVTPKELDKPVTQTRGFFERITYALGLLGIGGGAWMQDWRAVAALVVALLIVVGFGLLFHARIIATVKALKEAVTND